MLFKWYLLCRATLIGSLTERDCHTTNVRLPQQKCNNDEKSRESIDFLLQLNTIIMDDNIMFSSQIACDIISYKEKTRPSRPTMRPLWMNVFLRMNDFFLWMNGFLLFFFTNECHLWMINYFMNELLNIYHLCWVRPTFRLKKCKILIFLMNALPTNQPTNQPTYGHSLSKRCEDASKNSQWGHEEKRKKTVGRMIMPMSINS